MFKLTASTPTRNPYILSSKRLGLVGFGRESFLLKHCLSEACHQLSEVEKGRKGDKVVSYFFCFSLVLYIVLIILLTEIDRSSTQFPAFVKLTNS